MNKTIRLWPILVTIPFIVMIIIGVYFIGVHVATSKGQTISAETYFNERSTAQEKYNRLANDYDSACYNYQALYEAYDQLYAKVGAGSGLQKLPPVDGARGNEDSCYR